MSAPELLLVDDSEAILAFESAVLSRHYRLSTARNGGEALERLAVEIPRAVLLDLSMPELDGEGVIARMRSDPAWSQIPVIVVSSEHERGRRLVGNGAEAFIPKPIRADELLAAVEAVLEASAKRLRARGIAWMPLRIGRARFGVSLEAVRLVALQPATDLVPSGPEFLSEAFELHCSPVLVFDTGAWLGLERSRPLVDRRLVVLDVNGLTLALSVDDIEDPEESEAGAVVWRESVGGTEHGELPQTLVAWARKGSEFWPILRHDAFVDGSRLGALARAAESQPPEGGPAP